MTEADELRREKLEARRAMPRQQVEELSRRIAERLVQLPEYKEAGTVMIYKAVRGEVQLELCGDKRFLYPRCTAPGEMLALLPATDMEWEKGAFGIPEPVRELSVEIEPKDIDLVICPCTAFDSACRRLGMGGGYYDRFLPKCSRAAFVAVAYEMQRADMLPQQSWDVPMDAVVTETKLYRRDREE